MSFVAVRCDKAAFPRGCKFHPATAPAGSNRSSYRRYELDKPFGGERLKVADSVDNGRPAKRPLMRG